MSSKRKRQNRRLNKKTGLKSNRETKHLCSSGPRKVKNDQNHVDFTLISNLLKKFTDVNYTH